MGTRHNIFFTSGMAIEDTQNALALLLGVEWAEGQSQFSEPHKQCLVGTLLLTLFESNINYDANDETLWNPYSQVLLVRGLKHPNAIEFSRAAAVYWAQLMEVKLGWQAIVYEDLDHMIYPEIRC